MKQIIIKENEAGQRLDKFLHKYLTEAPNSFLYKMLRKKNITLNSKKADGSEKLVVGDTVALFLAEETIAKFRGIAATKDSNTGQCTKLLQAEKSMQMYHAAYRNIGKLDIIFENHHILLVNKPVGLLTQKAEKEDISLNEWLIGYMLSSGAITEEELATFKPSVCNRLDRNTSGIVICGKTLLGTQKMSAMLKDRSLHKFYRLYVKGSLCQEMYLEGYLKKDAKSNRVTITQKASGRDDMKYIATKYIPIAECGEMTLLEVELITGKPHQIRAHLSSVGHPLLGDYKYGDSSWNQSYKKRFGIDSQMLHAYRLEFPMMEAEFADISNLVITAKPPKAFTDIWESRQWQHGIQEG